MRSRRAIGVAVASLSLAACLLRPTAVERESDTLYLLPLGDSITQADRDHASYRYPLWQALTSRGANVDFVGSVKRHFKGKGPTHETVNGVAFDRDHEGHWGWRADEILAELPAWLELYPVDIALIHLGTNDTLHGQSVESTLDELTQIVALLRAKNPSITLLLARPGQSNWSNAGALPALATAISALSDQLNTPMSRVVAVPLDDRLTPSKTYDGLHPNADGERAMALGWLDAMDSLGLL